MITCSSIGLKKAEKPAVFKSKATYYNPVTRRWQEGNFMLHRNYVEFVTENSDEETKNPFHLSLPLATISSIEKRKSSFLFDAVMIRVGSEMHWFSSFPNRNAVYNNLELFWRDNLMVKSFNVKKRSNGLVDLPQNSAIGKELLSVLYDSEKHLVGAASALEEQSRQLHETEETVNDMNGDLSIVEKQINAMNFWPGTTLNSSAEKMPRTDEKKTDFRKRRYNVTFSGEKTLDCYNEWEKGILVISDDIVLLDDKDNVKFSFPYTELKSVKVVSPWELCIAKENGKETSCYVMCPMLSRVLRVFAAIPPIKEKVIYKSDDDGDIILNNSSSSSVSLASASSTPSSPNICWSLPDLPLLCEQVEKVRGSGYLTDEEIQEISSRLTDLHGLATEVEKEKQAQMERISALIQDVDKTDTRLNADTKKMKQLT